MNEIVPWVPNEASNNCSICSIEFSFIERKHHCRLCGNLICNACSRNLPIKLILESDIRACKQCSYLLTLYPLTYLVGKMFKIRAILQSLDYIK